MSTDGPTQPFAVGDRVVYLDPDRPPGDTGMPMPGEVTWIDNDHGVTVVYDAYRHLPANSPARSIWFPIASLDRTLASEEDFLADPHAVRPARAPWVDQA